MSHRPHMILIGAGLLSLSPATVALAASSPGDARKGPPATRVELQTKLEQRFDALDANKDGTVTVEERRAAHAQARDAMRERMFARLDADKNGSISKEEFAASHPRGPGRGHAWRDGPRRHHMVGAMRDGPAADRDKPITRTAFVDAGLSRFDRVDTDHDGKISPAERDAARKAMRDRLAPANRPAPPPPGL